MHFKNHSNSLQASYFKINLNENLFQRGAQDELSSVRSFTSKALSPTTNNNTPTPPGDASRCLLS
jgi:hypothetical protein